MDRTRRAALVSLLVSYSAAKQQIPNPPAKPVALGVPGMENADQHGKSKEQIAEENRAEALKEAEKLVEASEQLRDELKKAGVYIAPADSVSRAKTVEKLSRHIQKLLKD